MNATHVHVDREGGVYLYDFLEDGENPIDVFATSDFVDREEIYARIALRDVDMLINYGLSRAAAKTAVDCHILYE